MHSCILSFFVSLWIRLWNWIKKKSETSFFCSVFRFVKEWFDKSYKNSFLVRFFAKNERTDQAFSARYGKVSRSIRGFCCKILFPLSQSVTNSKICLLLNTFWENCKYYSLRNYGVFMLLLGVGSLLANFIFKNSWIMYLPTAIFLFSGVVLVAVKESFSELLGHSFFFGLSKIPVTGKRIETSLKKPLILGVVAGVFAMLTDTIPVALAIAGVLAIAFLYKYTEISLIAFIVLLPFSKTMIMVAGVLLLVAVFISKTLLSDKEFKFRYSSVNLFMLLFGAVYVWGVINSYAKLSSAKCVLVYLAFMLVYYLILNLLSDRKRLWTLFRLLCVASVPCAVLGIYQYMNPEQLTVWQDADMFDDIAGRIVSFFENPNVYGEYLIIMILVHVGVILHSERASAKLFYFVSLAMNVLCMFLTYSRGCWIGVAVALMLFFFMKRRGWFIAAICVGFVSLFFLPESIINRILSIGNLADTSTSYRMYIWEGTVHMLKDFWITGVGVGSDAFNHIYPIYSYGAIAAPHPHNLYLLILSETGLIGILTFICLIVLVIKKLFVVANKNDMFCSTFAAILLSAILGFLIQGVFDNVWYNYRVFLFFFIIVGISVALSVVSADSEVEKHD